MRRMDIILTQKSLLNTILFQKTILMEEMEKMEDVGKMEHTQEVYMFILRKFIITKKVR
mgnify:CR=1 FL=1